MRLRPAFIVLSLIVLPPMCFFLSWVMFIEFLRCVVAWFVLVSGWLIGTVLYALRRRHKYKANWLPDRVANAGGMDTVRRAEAVEVFKVISAAYDTERLSA